ncbi:MAG: CdaR family protein [Tissierellaceae bacterium]
MSKGKNNITAKIFALIIAVILRSYVLSEVNPDEKREYKNINVSISNTAELDRQGLVVMEPKEAKINVRVMGKRAELDRFMASNIVAKVDLSGYSEGQVRASVNVNLVNNLSDVKIINYEPKEILFSLDQVVTKEKSVIVKTTGELSKDYVLGDISSKPQTVLIRGPRTWVNEVAEVIAVVDVTGQSENSHVTVPLQLKDDKGNDVRGVEKDPGVVDVNIPILNRLVLPIELQTIGELPENYNITDIKIEPDTVAIKGDRSILTLDQIKTKPIDVNSLLNNTSMEVELELPENANLVDPNLKVKVGYTVEEVVTKNYMFNFEEVDIRNLNKDLILNTEELKDTTILINVKGMKGTIEELTKEDIKPYLDLDTLEEGRHEVEIGLDYTKEIQVESINPTAITIDLGHEKS